MVPQAHQNITEVNPAQIQDASARLQRFAPYLKKVFPELEATNGIIESELRGIPAMAQFLNQNYDAGIRGRLMLKMDCDLPVSGSVKARGGIYEVLKHAEDLALESGMLKETDDYSILAEIHHEILGTPQQRQKAEGPLIRPAHDKHMVADALLQTLNRFQPLADAAVLHGIRQLQISWCFFG